MAENKLIEVTPQQVAVAIDVVKDVCEVGEGNATSTIGQVMSVFGITVAGIHVRSSCQDQ